MQEEKSDRTSVMGAINPVSYWFSGTGSSKAKVVLLFLGSRMRSSSSAVPLSGLPGGGDGLLLRQKWHPEGLMRWSGQQTDSCHQSLALPAWCGLTEKEDIGWNGNLSTVYWECLFASRSLVEFLQPWIYLNAYQSITLAELSLCGTCSVSLWWFAGLVQPRWYFLIQFSLPASNHSAFKS